MPITADKRAQVSFFTNYLFFRHDYADTYTYPHTLRFSDTLCLKNALNTFFLKLHFFPLYSFSLPPKHFLIIFFGKLATKNGQKTSRKEEKIFFLFLKFFSHFPSPLTEKNKTTYFFRPFYHCKSKNRKGKRPLKKEFFFFFFLTFFHPTAPRNRKNYHLPFFSKFRLKVPLYAAKSAQVSIFTNYLCFPP